MEMSLAPLPGATVVEIDGLKLKAGAPDPKVLRKIAQTHKVSKAAAHSTLAKRT
jgi:hypothetical protein